MIITFKQMPTNININNISGATPFNVYLCDEFNITCIYIDTVPSSSLPYNFQVPSIMEGQVSFNIKVVDNNSCTSISNIIIVMMLSLQNKLTTIISKNFFMNHLAHIIGLI
jgi:hypothetical protein